MVNTGKKVTGKSARGCKCSWEILPRGCRGHQLCRHDHGDHSFKGYLYILFHMFFLQISQVSSQNSQAAESPDDLADFRLGKVRRREII